MDGITEIPQSGYRIFYIENLSDELKNRIRDWLSKICYGESNAASGRPTYSYKNALKHFLHLYENINETSTQKTENRKKGLVGELLVHVIMLEFYTDYSINSAFFNLEEHSYKKGFDVVLSNKISKEIWILETKSGNLKKDKNNNDTIKSLLSIGKSDLKKRLNENNDLLWQNAINHAKCYMDDQNNDEKDAVLKLLGDYADNATLEKLKSTDINVMLAGMLFYDITDKFSEESVSNTYTNYKQKNEFKDIHLIAMQKNTYAAIVDFLKAEQSV